MMTFHPNRLSAALIAAPFSFAVLLPAQGYGSLSVTQIAQNNPPVGVADHGMASRADGSWLLFGGEQSSGLLAATYIVVNDVWQPRVSVLNPAQRTGHQLAFDAARGDSLMFGGKDLLGNALDDTWVFANNQWSYRPIPASPPARHGHRMCFDAARGLVVLFGGKGASQVLLQDTWTWNGSLWSQSSTALAPAARFEHGIAYDSDRQKVVLFGGEAASGLRSDVWEWDGAGWAEVIPTPSNGAPFGPDARSQHAMGFDASSGRVVVFGGHRGSAGLAGDAWSFDGASWMGLLAGSGSAVPAPRSKVVFASGASGRLRAFGGSTAAGFSNEVWELTLPIVPIVPRVIEYGAPCIGGAGPLLLRPVSGSSASIGSTLALQMTGLSSPFALSWGFLGFSRTSVGGLPLPADLAPVGIPGCNAYGSAEYSFGLGLPSGSPLQTLWNLPIPNDTYFVGLEVYLQGIALESFGFTRFATATNGVSVLLGSNAGSSWNLTLVEGFSDETNVEVATSGGVWSNGARPAPLGGDGRHGSFNPQNGTEIGAGTYLWNLDGIPAGSGFTIPGSQTFNGQPAVITDSTFFFSDFVLPAGTTVRFAGTNPVKIYVRGKVEINGRLQANGADQVTFNCRNTNLTLPSNPVPGQLGSLGGPGGARGGQGGDRCLGAGAQPANNGRNGQDLLLPAGHAYAAAAVGTGGRGSPIHPLHGLDTSLFSPPTTYGSGGVFNSNVGLGGSGGGFFSIGGSATNVPVVPNVVQILPASAVTGGIAFDPLPLPTPSTSSMAQFLIGGSGGGGGGSHPFLGLAPNVTQFNADRWKAGGGGSGGGGVLVIRSGRSINVGMSGAVEVRGGRGATYNGDSPATPTQDSVSSSTGVHWGIPVPGGGGSGGSALLQASRDIIVEGIFDASGGTGGKTDGILPNVGTTSLDIDNRAGDGAPGFYRLEAVGNVGVASAANVPAFNPSRNAAALPATERDTASGCRSLWRTTGLPLPPQWLRYEMQVDVDGDGVTDRLYSDDPALPGQFGLANDPLGPVTVKFQGARVNSIGVPDPATIRQWRDLVGNTLGVGINSDLPTGFRFQLIFNTQAFPNCVVKRIEVLVRG